MINGEAFHPPVFFLSATFPWKSTRPLLTKLADRLSSYMLIYQLVREKKTLLISYVALAS